MLLNFLPQHSHSSFVLVGSDEGEDDAAMLDKFWKTRGDLVDFSSWFADLSMKSEN